MKVYLINSETNEIVSVNDTEGKFEAKAGQLIVTSDLIFKSGDIFSPLGNEYSRENRRVEILKEIEALEIKQDRPLRELRLNPNSEIAMAKLLNIDNEIVILRAEYNSLGAL